jgi:glycosyl transferase family 25
LKIRVINVASANTRMAFQDAQLTRLGLIYERFEAITPDNLSPPCGDPSWAMWERPMRDIEKALYASHRSVWALIAVEDGPCLVLEDDALLSVQTPRFLTAIKTETGIDHISLEVRNRAKYVAKTPDPSLPLRRLYQDRTGAAAYVLWPNGAAKLLARPVGLADAVICAAYNLTSYQADPALAIQIDQCEIYGVPAPIQVSSSPLSQPKPDVSAFSKKQQTRFRQRRIVSQIRMAVRSLCRVGVAQRRMISIAPDFRP